MKPVIGVPLRYQKFDDGRAILYLPESVRRTIQKAGGELFVIPPVQDIDYFYTKGNEFPELTASEKSLIHKMLDNCDGIMFPGGIKFTPYDRYLLDYAIEKQIPALGICLGMQMMSCYKEEVKLEANSKEIDHNQEKDDELTHKVTIDKNSKLYDILGKEELLVNSFHLRHAIDNHIYKTVAKSSDGQIEAIEYPGTFFNIGVQWHPEISYSFDLDSKKIIDELILEAIKYHKINKKKEIINNG